MVCLHMSMLVCMHVDVYICLKIQYRSFMVFLYIYIHYITLRYVTLRCVALRYVTLRYITLHYITLHYIPYIHTYIHTHICTNRLCIQAHGTYCKNRVIAQNIPSPNSISLVGLLMTQRMMREDEEILQPTYCFGAVTCHTLRKENNNN